jgi:hypothetical protein
MLNPDTLKEIFAPYMHQPFLIEPDGTAQLAETSTGRFGFFTERLFGISANRDSSPDLFGKIELKTINNFNKISIGNMTREEHARMQAETEPNFYTSKPWLKMQNALYVSYSNFGNNYYKINNYQYFDLNHLGDRIRLRLEDDYAKLWTALREYRYEEMQGRYRVPDTWYLKSSYKGNDKGYYPNWQFSSSFVKTLLS